MSVASSPTYSDDFFVRPKPAAPARIWNGTIDFIRRKPLGAFGALVLIIVVVVALFSPWIAKDPVDQTHLNDLLLRPNATYWLGTDHNGRDIYSRIVYGAQVTALVGVGTVVLVGLISVTVGLVSGYFMGWLDFIVQRVVDVWIAFPAIFLILTMVAVLDAGTSSGFFGLGRGPEMGPDPRNGPWIWYTFPRTTIVILVLGVVLAGGASRVVRSAVLSVKANPYIEAAHVLGANNTRIILRHILPNIMPTVIVLATVQLGVAVLAEATLSFLGVGVTNFPTWGQMLSGRTRDLLASNLHLGLFPGLAIFIAVFGFNMLGDALRDVLDPRLRGSR
jgi:peptide/nickel transport system permease protein